jgi:L-alanine-DL-glutamate epimerase-like enolase superfamily enzyme
MIHHVHLVHPVQSEPGMPLGLCLSLHATIETWPLREAFVIARGVKSEARVVVVGLSDGAREGRGECVPYARYDETVEGVLAEIEACRPALSTGALDRTALQSRLKPGAARNALDCALWDLEAKRAGKRAAQLAGLSSLGGVVTCYTLSLAAPAEMARKARAVPDLPLLKLKLGGGPLDAERMRAVRAARPDARLVADANESWSPDDLAGLLAVAYEARLEAVEQPLPATDDAALARVSRPVPVIADESAHVTGDIPRLAGRYDAVNIKLDKAGGLSEALAMAEAARAAGLRIMVGCMVATSLSMAPAMLLAQGADWVDLDGPLLLARDRELGLAYQRGIVSPPSRELWG